MSGLTYVTAYISIYDNSPPMQRTDDWRLTHFKKLAVSGIQLCVYVSPDYYDALSTMAQEYPNIKVMDPVILEETYIAKVCQEYSEANPDRPYTLPNNRNMEKDTVKYMQVQSCKMLFVQDALTKNPWNSSHFAWIDFSIGYMFKQLKRSQTQLQVLANSCLKGGVIGMSCKTSDNLLVPLFLMPGCWGQWDIKRHDHHMDHIHWRFCGCFFLADRNSMSRFCEEYKARFPEFLQNTGKLLWEVNIWAWIEHVCDKAVWKPRWYDADHNDRCLQIPNDLLCQKVEAISTTKYDYPYIEHFRPSSASHVFYDGKHWLNTRYVSYYLTPQSYYIYSDGTKIIKNKNMIVELTADISENDRGQYKPNMQTFMVMDADTVALPALQPDCFSQGLEDLRLYVGANGQVKFVGTSVEHSTTGRGQMVVGNYDPYTAKYSNCRRVNSPNTGGWEKNWIPILRPIMKNVNNEDISVLEEWFIYKWCPMELAKLIEKEDGELHLEVIEKHDTSQMPWFDRFRGSSTFMPITNAGTNTGTNTGTNAGTNTGTNAGTNSDTNIDTNAEGRDLKGTVGSLDVGSLGIVHFSEEGSPRHYYHCLVEIDGQTLKPLRCSAPFYFQNVGVEFCTGMTVNDDNTYTFWISQMDRDPLMIVVDQTSIVMNDC